MMMLTRFLFFVTCLSVCHSKRNSERIIFSTLKCAGPKHLDALGCAFKSPYGKVYQLNEKSISYEDDTIHCLCKTQNYNPKKLCGILIENVQEKHVGKWECMLTYNINGKNVTAKGSTYLKIKEDYATSTESEEESEEGSGKEPITKDTTTIRSTIEYTTRQTTVKIQTTSVPSERPMLELKTATEEWAQSDGDFHYKFLSNDGSCEISILDNPGDDMANGAIDRYTGDQLESCSEFEADDISSVIITHDRGDGWMGEYLKMYLGDKVFYCTLGKWVEKDSPKVEFPCSRES